MQYPGKLIGMGSDNCLAVKEIKKRLNLLHYPPLDETNCNFGESTAKTVKMFQVNNQLLDDAVVGSLTWKRLFNPRANEPVESKILRIRALQIANTQLKVRELTGHNDGAEVKAYLNAVGLGQGYAWCMAFIYWCFDKAAKELGVKNPLPKTGGVLDFYAKAKQLGFSIVEHPLPGDLGIMDFGGGKGHIFIVDANDTDQDVFTVEGNTNDANSREGDGVYERTRLIRTVKAWIRVE